MLRSALALLLGVAAAAVAVAASPGGAQSTIVIRLNLEDVSRRLTDRPPKGPSAGDTELTTSRLRNAVAQLGRPKGAYVGSDRVMITVLGPKSGTIDGVVKLPGGTIKLRGRLRVLAHGAIAPLDGGTGAFAGARGTASTGRADGKVLQVYRVRLP